MTAQMLSIYMIAQIVINIHDSSNTLITTIFDVELQPFLES